MAKNIDNMELRVLEKNSILSYSIHRYFNWTKEDGMKAFRVEKTGCIINGAMTPMN